jgi:integrase
MDKNQKTSQGNSRKIKFFTYPKLHSGKDWYIDFYAFDPAAGNMRRKKFKLNHIDKIGLRRKYADGLIRRVVEKLENGWNPWIEAENGKAYYTFADACLHYKRYIEKMLNDNVYREDTYASYLSFIRNIERWNNGRKPPITYIYQFNADFVRDFIEYIYLEKNNSAQTHNNYLCFIGTFSNFLIQNRYINIRPTDGMVKISRRKIKKQRTIIQEIDMKRLAEYLKERDLHYLLACYILHYCFVRPREMSLIQIGHISVINKTLFIPEDNSKNRKSATVTLPVKVIHLMLELEIFNHPGNYYLFSNLFVPGRSHRDEKQFRDYWHHHVRKDLKFPPEYKFYSLKDTGITSMLKKFDTLTVRDQARHATILMTDTYTPHDIQQANELIVKHEGIF